MEKLPILIIGGTFLITALLIFGLNDAGGQGKITISPVEYDFGEIPINGGLVIKTFEIQNTGSEELKLTSISTSCMCTTAHLSVAGKESPEFGMHDSPALWSQGLAPGEKGSLEVVFDPAFHGPEGTGEIVRVIYISSNDAQAPKTQVKLIGKVVK